MFTVFLCLFFLQLACYDQAKQLVLGTGVMGDNILTHFLSSFIAGGCATFLCQPLDVLKTRLMNSKGEYTGVLHCLRETAKLGPLAFYKGLVPAGIRLIPHTVLTFVFLEQLKKYFGIRVISWCAPRLRHCQSSSLFTRKGGKEAWTGCGCPLGAFPLVFSPSLPPSHKRIYSTFIQNYQFLSPFCPFHCRNVGENKTDLNIVEW